MGRAGEVDEDIVLGDDRAVHLFGDVDETGLFVQSDDREVGGAGSLEGNLGYDRQPSTELDDEPDRVGLDQGVDELFGLAVCEGESGGEDQFASGEHAGEIGDFADVHPAHPAPEVTLAGEHFGLTSLHGSRGDYGAQGGQHDYKV